MGDKTGISWTDATWNPTRGCSVVSAGCKNCYAMHVARRFSGPGQPYEGLVRIGKDGKSKAQWNGVVRMVPERLADPLRWKRPRRIFVNSMSDLFHEALAFEDIAAVFGVMAAAPQHTFQVLTKRPERALEFFAWVEHQVATHLGIDNAHWLRDLRRPDHDLRVHYVMEWLARSTTSLRFQENVSRIWPLPNVHLLVSVEDQTTADERIPLLLQCPAAVHGVSYEPALGPVDFGMVTDHRGHESDDVHGYPHFRVCLTCSTEDHEVPFTVPSGPGIDWIIVGGESGPGARPFDVAWTRSTVEQCKAAGVACFVKQLGARPVSTVVVGLPPRPWIEIRDRKGGDWTEWPEDLRVREFPGE